MLNITQNTNINIKLNIKHIKEMNEQDESVAPRLHTSDDEPCA